MKFSRFLHFSLNMIDTIRVLFHRLLRVCIYCSSIDCGDSLFCGLCEKKLWSKHNGLKQIQVDSLQVSYLFDWFPDDDPMLNMLLNQMKGSAPKSLYASYAQRICDRLPQIQFKDDTAIVPCPSRGDRIHALLLAEAFAKQLSLPVLDILELADPAKDQKGRTKSERQHIRMRLKQTTGIRHVIFIDDIVTTGATAKAARLALRSVEGFEVFCLAHRRHLATKLTF